MMVPIRFALVLAVCVVSSRALQAQTTLQYQFKKGDTLRYVLTVAQKGTNKGDDMEFNGAQSQSIEMTWQVESVDEKGTAKIALRFDRAKLMAQGPKEMREVSSDAKEEPTDEAAKSMYALAKALAKFQGSFTVSARGEIQNVTVPASVLKEMKAVPGAEKASESWAEEHLQSTLKDNILLVPPTAIAKGKSWKNSVKGQSPFGKLSGDMHYVYDGSVERDGRKVEKFLLRPKFKIEPDPKAQIAITIKAFESEGTAYFDNATGRLVEVASTQRLEVEAESMGKTYSQKTETTNGFKLLKSGK